MTLVIKQAKLKNGQYYDVAHKKTSIFLHHTAGGNAKGALAWWDQTPDIVGTAYVVDRDGTVFQAFDDAKWGFHLGVNGDNNEIEKCSVGIEIVSRGWLVREGDKYFHYPLFPNKTAKTEVPASEVWDMGKNRHQGYQYFHNYTPAQITAVMELLTVLVRKYRIAIQPEFKDFFKYRPEVAMKNLPGIWSHTTVRKDKTDIVPHKDFIEPLMGLVKALTEVPKTGPDSSPNPPNKG